MTPHRFIAGLAVAASMLASTAEAQISTRPGVGAVPYTSGSLQGVTFRTWAPNASEVSVIGSFNNWSTASHKLTSEGNGWWSRDVLFVGAGAQYKFAIRNGTTWHYRADARSRVLTNSVGDSIVYNPNAYQWQTQNFQVPLWTEMVTYEMHVGTFNVPAGHQGPGTFQTAAQKLDYLRDMGINAIALMPVCEFSGDYSWGYNPAHPFSVEEAYGGPDALKSFIDQAHARGIAVMGDVVYNHFGPQDMSLWQYDGWSTNNEGGIFFFQDYRADTWWGPRPDYGRSEVRSYIRDNTMMWLEEFRMDGMRFDGTKFIRMVDLQGPDIPEGWSLMQWCNDSADAHAANKLMIAEDLGDNAWMTKTTGAGGAGFDTQWDGAFAFPVRAAIEASSDSSRDMFSVRDAILKSFNGQMQQRMIYTESHDEVANGRTRVPEAIFPGNAGSWFSRKRSTLGGALVLTAPGIPMMFQGQEILEDGWFAAEDPLDWSKLTTYSGINRLYKDLIGLRRNLGGVTKGLTGYFTNVHHVNNGAKVIGYHRWANGGAGDDVVILANFSNTSFPNYRIGLPRGGKWRVRFNSDSNLYSADYGNFAANDINADNWGYDGLGYSGNFRIAPYSVVIYSQSPPSPYDLNGDLVVNGADLGTLLAQWGMDGTADFNNDNVVNGADLGQLLAAWGPVP